MQNMKVEVTQYHLSVGTPNCEHSCPVALAILNQYPEVVYCCVEAQQITISKRINGGFETNDYTVPTHVSNWIHAFDGGSEELRPFSFEMELN